MEEISTNTTTKRCAVVTGGNKGIGLEICRQLASNEITVILTARDEKRGHEAVKKLISSGLFDVIFHQLDVTDPISIASLAKFIETHFRKLDILVNNAGDGGLVLDCEAVRVFKQGAGRVSSYCMTDANANLLKGIVEQPYEKAEPCVKTNYYGTKGVTEGLLGLLQHSNSPRIVNVSSFYGQLKFICNEKAKADLNNVDDLSEEKLDTILQWFLKDFKEDKLQESGWPLTTSAYKVSKAAVNAYTRLIAKRFPNFLVNCVHPGMVKTDLNCNIGNLTAEEGARFPVHLALLDDNGPSGLFFHEMDVSNF